MAGKVGSAKSSLIAALLGETFITNGMISSKAKVAYVEQEPRVFHGTLQSNILFGLPLDEKRLDEVIKACQLTHDLALFPKGLNTIIGERGLNISGGQKARISLARACYSDADLYLLDDPLSAVDPRVAKRLVTQCFKGYLSQKTVILVTHQLQFLNKVDEIVFLKDGRSVFQGDFEKFKEFYSNEEILKEGEHSTFIEEENKEKWDDEEPKKIGNYENTDTLIFRKLLTRSRLIRGEKEEVDGGFRVFIKYLKQYPGCGCNIFPLIMACHSLRTYRLLAFLFIRVGLSLVL